MKSKETPNHPRASPPPVDLDGFTDRVRLLIKAFGSVAKVARMCGLSELLIRRWRDGVTEPSRKRCVALARGTGISPLWLLVGAGPMWIRELPQHEQKSLALCMRSPRFVTLPHFGYRLPGIAGSTREDNTIPFDRFHFDRDLDRSALVLALKLVEVALDSRAMSLEGRAELIGHVYAHVALPGLLQSASIEQLIKSAATAVADRFD